MFTLFAIKLVRVKVGHLVKQKFRLKKTVENLEPKIYLKELEAMRHQSKFEILMNISFRLKGFNFRIVLLCHSSRRAD